MIPLVAIVGRPNVGKSTMFNRFVRSYQKAIVQDDPGVTRDRHYGTAKFEGRIFNVVDTGGFAPDAKVGIEVLVREQTQLAIEEADVVVVVMDAREGLLEVDKEVVRTLRQTGKPIIYAINKIDGPKQESFIAEFYQLGADQMFPISAEHGLGFDSLIDAILESLPPEATPKTSENNQAESTNALSSSIKIALVGRPNAGKSSLLNALVGQPRAIVSETPGTTRDPIDVQIQTPQGLFTIIDTAGIRRQRSVDTAIEKYAILRAFRSINNADVTCLLIDAIAGVAEQDAKIAGLALDAGKGLALIFTKIDLLPSMDSFKRQFKNQVNDKLQFLSFAPTHFISSKTGKGVRHILPLMRKINKECGKRIATAELNRFLEDIIAAHPPPSPRGRPVRFYYITQPKSTPPTFVISTNYVAGVHITYRRYIINKLRERFSFTGSPIRLLLRQHNKRSAQQSA